MFCVETADEIFQIHLGAVASVVVPQILGFGDDIACAADGIEIGGFLVLCRVRALVGSSPKAFEVL